MEQERRQCVILGYEFGVVDYILQNPTVVAYHFTSRDKRSGKQRHVERMMKELESKWELRKRRTEMKSIYSSQDGQSCLQQGAD